MKASDEDPIVPLATIPEFRGNLMPRTSRRMMSGAAICQPSRANALFPIQNGLIPDCGDTDSSAARSALEHGAYIPLDHRTFLQ
jgi:hypothetical protein